LVQQYQTRVLALCRRILANEDDAQDACQEVWFSMWRAVERLQWGRDPWPFIRKTAVRKAIDRIRVSKRNGRLETGLIIEPSSKVVAPVVEIDLSFLNWEERACLVLFFWEECSVKEIAEQLRVPTGTVKTWMFRARGKLKRKLSNVDANEESA
jgi:RNA polymerase sigma-70 factor (ECF subfamily)